MSALIRENIELAKAEMTAKAMSIARGAVAVVVGAVFAVFALIFALEALAWGLNDVLVRGVGNIWLGFTIVFGVLALLMIGAFLFAWSKLRVGPPTPTMAIDEAKKIRETVATGPDEGREIGPGRAESGEAVATRPGTETAATPPEGEG